MNGIPLFSFQSYGLHMIIKFSIMEVLEMEQENKNTLEDWPFQKDLGSPV